MARKYKGITKSTKLLLKKGESQKVDYKVKLNGLHAEDLVAFSNSENGGYILIGVDETESDDGSQVGMIMGHAIGDKQELAILDKASQCIPPIKVSVSFENTSDIALIKISIPPGSQKPYCTMKGMYKIRDGNRNKALHPSELLEIFMNNETGKFASRFKESTSGLVSHLSDVSRTVGGLEDAIASKIDDISSSMMMAEWEAEDASSSAKAVLGLVQGLKAESSANRKRIKSVVDNFEISDPLINDHKKSIRNEVIQYFNEKGWDEIIRLIKSDKPVELSIDPMPDSLTQTHVNEVTEEVLQECIEILKKEDNEISEEE